MSARSVRRQWLLSTAILCVGLIYFSTGAQAQSDKTEPSYSGYSLPWVELSGLPGSDTSAFGARAIAPLAVGHGRLFFLGLDGVLYDSGVDDWFQGDFGRVRNGGAYLGLRRYVANDWIFGIWGGADAQNTLVDNSFGRFIGGLELYSNRWVLRLNGAAPFDDNNFVDQGNADRAEASPIRTALNRGVRGELDLYPLDDVVFGTRLTFEAEYEHDDRFDGSFMGGLRVAVPLGTMPTSTQGRQGSRKPTVEPEI